MTSPDAPQLSASWLTADPGPRAVLAALETAGHQAFYVGGCVRDALLGRAGGDIDVATDARPEAVLAIMQDAGLRTVETGIDHGTVTALSGVPVEVTTFRRDVATDGRRATVAFSDTVGEDAARRDFTINALYADTTGRVIDPLGGGLEDLAAARVRFIGDAATRIREDGLRVLRFFRFTAHFAPPGAAPDAEGLAAISAAPDALRPVSRERIGAEMIKLLSAPDPGAAVTAMADIAVLDAALPGADADRLPPLIAAETAQNEVADWIRRLCALGADDPAKALRLPRKAARRIELCVTHWPGETPLAVLAEMFGAQIALDAGLLRAAAGRTLAQGWRVDIARGAAASFPVSAADLLPRYGAGPALGAALAALRTAWRESDFALDRAALLEIDSRSPV